MEDAVFARRKIFVSDWDWEPIVLTERRETDLETQLLKVGRMSRPKFFLPSLTELYFETCVFERVWPPLERLVLDL